MDLITKQLLKFIYQQQTYIIDIVSKSYPSKEVEKLEILKKCKRLKGTEVRIAHDLNNNLETINFLYKHLNRARDSGVKAHIKNNLYVNGDTFTKINLENTDNLLLCLPNSIAVDKAADFCNIKPSGTNELSRKETVINRPVINIPVDLKLPEAVL